MNPSDLALLLGSAIVTVVFAFAAFIAHKDKRELDEEAARMSRLHQAMRDSADEPYAREWE